MSARERSGRLHLAARKQRGRMLAPAMLETLSGAVQQTLSTGNLLPLEETDNLFGAYTDAFQKCVRGEMSHLYLRSRRADARSLFSRLVHMGQWLDGDDVVMFNRLFSYTGAVKMPAAPFFAAVETLLLLEVDDLRAASSDGLQGLLIDSLDRENALELWCWGEEWLALVRETEEEKGDYVI